jgi:hypothetical protein
MPAFHRYIGIDYSGAETPTSSLNNLRVFMAAPGEPAREEPPPPGPAEVLDQAGHCRVAGRAAD